MTNPQHANSRSPTRAAAVVGATTRTATPSSSNPAAGGSRSRCSVPRSTRRPAASRLAARRLPAGLRRRYGGQLAAADDLVDQAVLDGLVGSEDLVALDVLFYLLRGAPG